MLHHLVVVGPRSSHLLLPGLHFLTCKMEPGREEFLSQAKQVSHWEGLPTDNASSQSAQGPGSSSFTFQTPLTCQASEEGGAQPWRFSRRHSAFSWQGNARSLPFAVIAKQALKAYPVSLGPHHGKLGVFSRVRLLSCLSPSSHRSQRDVQWVPRKTPCWLCAPTCWSGEGCVFAVD